MRKITVDFSLQTYPLFAGYVGEHNATELTAIKPVDLEGVTYSLAFMTNGEVIHSKFFGADEEIRVTLWQQLTQDNTLYVQLEAYDENGDYLGKSGMVKLVLSNSVHGMDMIADADNPDVYSEIAQNSAFREVLEDNADTLDKLTTSVDGKLLFDGKEIEGSSGNVSDELVEQIETNTENRHWHDNKTTLDKFGIVNGYPVFNSTSPKTLAYTSDIPAPMTTTDVNNAWDGSTIQIKSYLGNTALSALINLIKQNISTIPKFTIKVVDVLPTEDISNTTVYLVKDTETDGNLYTEYIYINDVWEILGSQQVNLTEYAKTEDVPTKTSQLENDSGFVTETELDTAVETALTEAKASGEFDGTNGVDGQDGANGLSAYQIWLNAGNTGTEADFLASLKGDKGDSGVDGTSVTVASVSKSTEDGGSNVVTFSDGKTLTIQNGSKGSQGENGNDGVGVTKIEQTTTSTADGGTNVITATLSNGETFTFNVKNGSKGSTGATGTAGRDGADGYTPVKGTDYFTEADKAEMVEEVTASLNGIPDYWQTHLDEKIALIRDAVLTVGVNKSAFFFYSDSHWSNDTTYTAKKAPALLKYLCKNTPINKTNFGGDIVSAEGTDADTMAYLWEWRNMLYGLPNHHSVVGNHDDGNTTNNLFSENYVYGYLLAPEESYDIVRGDGAMYYYIDNPSEKTRYLYLDTAYQGVTNAEQKFVKSALISTPTDWHIVAIAHAWYENDYSVYPPVLNGFSSDAQTLLTMFDNYNTRSGEYADCAGWVEFCIGGHYHLDYVEHTTGGIPVIIVEADCLHDRSGTMPKSGTTDEAAISAIIADYNEKTIKIIRIGRGDDYEAVIQVSKVSYTNVLSTAILSTGKILNGTGWAANSRLGSGTLDNYVGNGSYYITGHIAIDPSINNVIRLQNVTWDSTTNNNYNYQIAFYDSSFKKLGQAYTTDIANISNGYNPVIEDSNIVQFTLTSSHYTSLGVTGAKYFAICCSYIGEDSIITINEPIE